MSNPTYAGIKFPDRAEALTRFSNYRVFLEPWDAIAEQLRDHWLPLVDRGQSGILAIHGQQGAGKTLFTKKIVTDFASARASTMSTEPIEPDENNIWHRVVGRDSGTLNPCLIRSATARTTLHEIENEKDWVKKAASLVGGQNDRACVLIADNAERYYFRQGLVEMSDLEMVANENSEGLNRLFAQRLVAHMRTDLAGSLLVILSNDEVFLLALEEEVEKQHEGLMTLANLRLPDAKAKEAIIRVNTNRLNAATYWSIVDQGSPDDRVSLLRSLEGGSSFPDAFKVVDVASRNRTGRPAKRNVINLLALVNSESAASVDASEIGSIKRAEVDLDWLSVHVFEEDWAPRELGQREAALLESEWVLRVGVLGNPFVRSLLEAERSVAGAAHSKAVVDLLGTLKVFNGPGTQEQTRTRYTSELEGLVSNWPNSSMDLNAFWGQGQVRSRQYEGALRAMLPGYDSVSTGFLTYRPDYVVEPYSVASVSEAIAPTNEAVRAAIKRRGNVFEFTTAASAHHRSIRDYLLHKLPNYAFITQEQ